MDNRVFLKLVLLILVQLPLTAQAIPFNNLYVFGDSLSDQGNDYAATGHTVPPSEYTDGATYGRFTNGRNYIDYLSKDLGLTVRPSLLGGTNYAYGGARINYQLPGNPALDLLQQRNAYIHSLAGGSADPNGLYIVWAGSNNISDILAQLKSDPTYNPVPALTTAAEDLGSVVSSLALAGARNILVPNIPDLGLVPAVTGGGAPQPSVSALVLQFDAGLNGVLGKIDQASPGLNLMRLNTFSLLDQIYKTPAAYGLTNVTDPCYSRFVAPGGTTCTNPNQYLFWDAEHPTSAVHRILATDVLRTIPEPATVPLFAIGLLGLSTVRRRLGRR